MLGPLESSKLGEFRKRGWTCKLGIGDHSGRSDRIRKTDAAAVKHCDSVKLRDDRSYCLRSRGTCLHEW